MLLKKVIQQKVFSAKKDAIIDLGSNSIRMLIYQDFINSQIPVFNEKAVCALGKTLDKTGRLDPEGVEYAYNVLERFKNILDNSKISSCEVIATAAVREAKDSKEFIEKVEQILNQNFNVLTAEEEAERPTPPLTLTHTPVSETPKTPKPQLHAPTPPHQTRPWPSPAPVPTAPTPWK